MLLTLFGDALQQALMFFPLGLGIYLSYCVVGVTDLTVDGTFVLGAAVFARLLTLGCSVELATIIALIAGALGGIFATIIQRLAKIDSLIASILVVFMLYSVNFNILSRPNVSLFQYTTLLINLQNHHVFLLRLLLLLFAIILILLIYILLKSRLGLLLRAYQSNLGLLKQFGLRTDLLLGLALAISNLLAACCGVITAQLDGYADINMGTGQALTAIGSVMIGLKLMHNILPNIIKNNNNLYFLLNGLACLLGVYLYFFILNLLLYLNINPIDLKLAVGLLLIFFLATAHYSRK